MPSCHVTSRRPATETPLHCFMYAWRCRWLTSQMTSCTLLMKQASLLLSPPSPTCSPCAARPLQWTSRSVCAWHISRRVPAMHCGCNSCMHMWMTALRLHHSCLQSNVHCQKMGSTTLTSAPAPQLPSCAVHVKPVVQHHLLSRLSHQFLQWLRLRRGGWSWGRGGCS